MRVLLEARGLTQVFARRGAGGGRLLFRAIDRVDLELRAGEVLAVVGESGCGKSTLLRCLAGFLPCEGELLLGGEDGRRLRGRSRRAFFRRLQLVFQDPSSALDPRIRIGSAVAEGLEPGQGDVPARVAGWLDAVGLGPEIAGRFPHQISGGQRQRATLARALAAEPEVLLLDEPFAALDSETRAGVLELLEGLRRRFGIPMVIVGHDLATLRRVASRVAVMYLGRVIELGEAAATLENPLHPYTRALLAAEPRPIPGRRPAEIPPGEVPIPWEPPAGCAYHPRCPRATDLCRRQAPPLETTAGRHPVACHHPCLGPAAGVSGPADVTFAPT